MPINFNVPRVDNRKVAIPKESINLGCTNDGELSLLHNHYLVTSFPIIGYPKENIRDCLHTILTGAAIGKSEIHCRCKWGTRGIPYIIEKFCRPFLQGNHIDKLFCQVDA